METSTGTNTFSTHPQGHTDYGIHFVPAYVSSVRVSLINPQIKLIKLSHRAVMGAWLCGGVREVDWGGERGSYYSMLAMVIVAVVLFFAIEIATFFL